MSKFRRVLILLAALTVLAPAAMASQAKAPAQKSTKKRPPAAKKAPEPPGFTAEAAQLAEQLKLLARFLYVYGRVSTGLETADERVELAKKNRADVVANIAGVRAGIEKVQASFHARGELQRQSARLLRAAELAGEAEKQAAAGRFDDAGRTLVEVAQRLADVLAEVP